VSVCVCVCVCVCAKEMIYVYVCVHLAEVATTLLDNMIEHVRVSGTK
jgi:hypothetical protein